MEFQEREAWKFPEGAVLAQSLALEMEPGNPKSAKWIETRVLLFEQNEWAGYTYRWNDEQTEAELLPSTGDDRELVLGGANGRTSRVLNWHYPSRTECLTCHSRAANFTLGLSTWQMNRDHAYAGVVTNQLRAFEQLGILKVSRLKEPGEYSQLKNPYDTNADLTNRVRAYLHANCSHCHTEAGGGNSAMELPAKTKLADLRIIDVRPQHDTFELPDARIIAPGHPERSVMFRRLSQRGYGQMPPLAITTVDEEAVRLFEAWIRALKPLD
jgi:mono/diheme cytochrome c family protein